MWSRAGRCWGRHPSNSLEVMEVEPIEKQVAVLMQGSEFGDQQIKEMMTRELRQRLTEASNEGRQLRVYCGYDVTAPDIHLGHTITMRKLRLFQDFGHEVYFVIGTFTTLIGDPSDRDEVRPMLTMEQIQKTAKTYTDQAFKVLDRNKTKVVFNHEWLSKLTFEDVIKMASNFTVQQFLTPFTATVSSFNAGVLTGRRRAWIACSKL